MTFVDDWNDFLHQVRLLYFGTPLKTRYVVKFKKGSNFLVLKVTDNKQCCKFKLRRDSHKNKLNQLTALFLRWSVERELSSPEDLPLRIEVVKPQKNTRRLNNRRGM